MIHTRRIPDDRVLAHRFFWFWAPLEKAEWGFFHHAPTAYEPGRSRPTSSLNRSLESVLNVCKVFLFKVFGRRLTRHADAKFFRSRHHSWRDYGQSPRAGAAAAPVDSEAGHVYLGCEMVADPSGPLRSLRVCFGRPATRLVADEHGIAVHLPLPHLAGPMEELVMAIPGGVVEKPLPGSALLTGGSWMAGAFVRPWHGPLDELSASLYRELLLHARGWNIGRVWNYVPHINCETTGLENYRRFNLGRWQAYHDSFGDRWTEHLPAASAVGLREDMLVAVFVATRAPVERIENPHQVPAWRYPAAYGPKAPSFVRAARAEAGGQRWSWVSGTASIRGHESVAPGDVGGQLVVTLRNLDVVLAAMDLPPLGAERPSGAAALAKVYLRRRGDLAAVQAHLGAVAEQAQFVEADVCRAELELEIEVTASTITDVTTGCANFSEMAASR